MSDKEKLSELLNPWLAYLSLCAAGDLIEKGVTIPVRCKDCKHYKTIQCSCSCQCISDDWYCADGERKDNEA